MLISILSWAIIHTFLVSVVSGWSRSLWSTFCVPGLCSSICCWWRDVNVYRYWYGSVMWRKWRSLPFQVTKLIPLLLALHNSICHYILLTWYHLQLDMAPILWEENIAMKWLCASFLRLLRYFICELFVFSFLSSEIMISGYIHALSFFTFF